jgi:hypothetical protein
MCRVDWGDPADFSDQELRVARRPRRCCECSHVIARGERYERATFCQDGVWSHYATCAFCVDARDWLSVNCGGWIYTEVLDELEEHFQAGEVSPDESLLDLGRLIITMHRRRPGYISRHLGCTKAAS